ncbi:uncharacterized protein LOC116339689 [Contarinia nasturtii]|uniref:uncharacterized protein LOC116339689 n=1 Tax=Contarinia nasturtii TaxID=265458 RepID=UPI0012D3DA24|nr:uncharacterized protein LOC116339689 [Contarinia nasturtii]
MIFIIFVLYWNLLAGTTYGQELGSKQFCTDLYPQTNVSVTKLIGTWFGAEVITHRDRVTGERSSRDCVFVVINEIPYEMATLRPLENPKEIVTQFGTSPSVNPMKDYRFLRLQWTELDTKLEYILRYNTSRKGFWFSSSPHEPKHYGEQPSFSGFSGSVQVIVAKDNYLMLTFCENIPQMQLYSIILTRQANTLSMDLIKDLREQLRIRELPNLYYRTVCSGVEKITVSCLLSVVVGIIFSIKIKWTSSKMKTKVIGFFAVLLAISKYIECDNMFQQQQSQQPQQPLFCSDLRPQNQVNIDQLLGMWYGNEIIMHHDTMRSDPVALDSCVMIHLSDITHEIASTRPRQPDNFQEYHNQQILANYDYNQRPFGAQQFNHLRLVWSEQDINLEYTLRFNTTRRGFWISSAPQKGQMIKLNYGQFTGVIQVMKVVSNQMILTFCENLPGKQFFTIVLSRQPNSISNEDMGSIHALLMHRGLQTVSVRKICNGSSSMHSISIVSVLFTAILAFLLKQK